MTRTQEAGSLEPMNADYEIPASWVSDYVDPDYDEYIEWMEEYDREQRDAEEAERLLRIDYYKSVM